MTLLEIDSQRIVNADYVILAFDETPVGFTLKRVNLHLRNGQVVTAVDVDSTTNAFATRTWDKLRSFVDPQAP